MRGSSMRRNQVLLTSPCCLLESSHPISSNTSSYHYVIRPDAVDIQSGLVWENVDESKEAVIQVADRRLWPVTRANSVVCRSLAPSGDRMVQVQV